MTPPFPPGARQVEAPSSNVAPKTATVSETKYKSFVNYRVWSDLHKDKKVVKAQEQRQHAPKYRNPIMAGAEMSRDASKSRPNVNLGQK